VGESQFKTSLGQIVHKTLFPKWTGGVAKVVECLLCKHKGLTSSISPNKKKKKKKRRKKESTSGKTL
jgi:hypothetical protein